jgi:hypothetical protein
MGSLASADEAADVLLISPSLLDTSQLTTFMGTYMLSNTTVVVAQSSSFSLFSTLEPIKASGLLCLQQSRDSN